MPSLPRSASRLRARRPLALALHAAALLLLLAACTGTRPDTTPVALLVAGQDGPDGLVRFLASPLPLGTDPEPDGYRLLPAFDRTVPGDLRDALVTRGGAPRAWILHRSDAGDGPRDRLAVYDLADLATDEPGSLAPAPDRTIDLGARVADAGVSGFDAPHVLCAVRATVATDGAWIGLLHRADACGGSASDVQALLIRTDPAPGATGEGDVVADPSVAYAAFPPAFVTLGGRPAAVWARPDGDLWRAYLDASEPPVAPLGIDVNADPTDLVPGRDGLLAGWSDAVAWISLPGADDDGDGDAGDAVARVTIQDGPLRALVAPGSLPGAPLLYRTDDELRVRPSPSESDQEGAARLPGLVAATVGPYDYAHALDATGVRPYDVLRWLGSANDEGDYPSTLSGAGVPRGDGHGLADPVAIDWTFLVPEEAPMP